MTFKEIVEGVLSGAITIDENQHNPFYGWGDKLLKDPLRERLKRWQSLKKNGDPVYPSFFKHVINRTPGNREPLNDFFDLTHCEQCGKAMRFIHLPESNSIKCIHATYKDMDPVIDDSPCVFAVKPALLQTFSVTGPVMFANFFREQMDAQPKDKQYGTFSLNHFAGIHALTEFHTQQNCVFCQTSNMFIHFFINKKMDRVIVVDRDNDDWRSEGEKPYVRQSLRGWTKLGEVSCDMWRWMLVNQSDIKSEESIGGQRFEADIPIGTWDVSHYINTSMYGKIKVGKLDLLSEMRLTSLSSRERPPAPSLSPR